MVAESTSAAVAPRRREYWQANSLAEQSMTEFQEAVEQKDAAGERRAFYLVASYYGRTVRILNTALTSQKEPLARAAMHNLIILHRPLAGMHAASPDLVPITLTLRREAREGFVRDLVVRVLSESPEGLDAQTVTSRVNDLDLIGNLRPGTVDRHLKNLVASGHVTRDRGRFTRASRVYGELDLSAHSLRALVGPDLYRRLNDSGFNSLADVSARQSAFNEVFGPLTGLSDEGLALFHEVVVTLEETWSAKTSPWRHADLLGSTIPRPYQYEAYAMFRGGGYRGLIVESPTGSGKTMIGQMCIQDWLRTLKPGQSVLVLVPTSNYQQQWIGELSYLPFGLRLSPEVIFAGTPNELERFQRRTGQHPAVLLMTYTALAQAGSGIGKGGFDIDSIEIFLQGANVQYVVLDEVHKVVEDMRSVSADVTRLMVSWLEDMSLRGLIGFSGTAEAYRHRFDQLRLRLVHNIPLEDLIAYGYVAPFAEFGVPFSNSARERRVRDLLDEYKERLRQYFTLLGVGNLRRLFAEVPLEERVRIARDILDMSRGDKDRDQALAKKMSEWERGSGDVLNLADAKLVTILQIARGWSDQELAQQTGASMEDFAALAQAVDSIRQQLAELIYLPKTVAQLRREGFATTFDAATVRSLPEEKLSHMARNERMQERMATTLVGLYNDLGSWYRRVGEGRVETIKAVIEAERNARPVSGVIVFDNARRIFWKQEDIPTPGYEGVGGLFGQMLGDERFLPIAVLSNEMYIGFRDEDPLPPRIATHIENRLMRGEIGRAIFSLVTQVVEIESRHLEALQTLFTQQLDAYIPTLLNVRAVRLGNFSRKVLGPVRREVKRRKLGSEGERLLMRLDLRYIHLLGLVKEFFDYALLARSFREAAVAQLEQVSGAIQKFFVVPMPGGNRKQLMYDLTARIVDAEELGVNLIIVSNWARTGWNVIKPNLLIDATATRDVTAWQQLRGRAIRSLRTWTNDCYRLMLQLVGPRSEQFFERTDLPEDVARAFAAAAATAKYSGGLDANLRTLLHSITPPALQPMLGEDGLDALGETQRTNLAINLMRKRNKVTHIYELVKAFGSTSQVIYDRPERVWKRRENIALKHANEISVQPFAGQKVYGDEHAPLLYASDPRNDLPVELEARVSQVVADCDPLIVAGWLDKADMLVSA
jgi:superfamily II DNA or RNA helicase